MKSFARILCSAVLMMLPGVPASAQESTDVPAHVSVVDGRASLERDGRPDDAPLSMPLVGGDRLRTADGRVEVSFGDGASLHVDASSVVDFQSDEVIRVLEGRVRLIIPGPRREISYRIDAPGGWVQIQEPGEYRVTVTRGTREPEVELVVVRGAADLFNDDGQTTLRAGERAFARAGAAPSYAYVYNSAAWDAFDRWSNDRRADSAGTSAQYLPETVRSYSSTFDRYGSWRHDVSYGYVWYPAVAAGWRPYFEGRWTSIPSFGWTWVGTNAWAWPTHHYGRWGFSAGAWFWIPGRAWGPAWVSWASAPGYVSWCPLGWDNRPAVSFVGGGYYSARHDPWRAWTVVPHQRFGTGYVHASFVGGSRLDARARGAFVVRRAAPETRGYAVPRNSAPIYAAGTRRHSAPGPQRLGTGSDPDVRSGLSSRQGPRDGGPVIAGRPPALARERASTTGGPAVSATEARSPRGGPEPLRRSGPAGTGAPTSGAMESRGVAIHRGTPPPAFEGVRPRNTESPRLDVPGYRRAPSSTQATPRSAAPVQASPSVPQRQSPWDRPAPGAAAGSAAERAARLPARQPVAGDRAVPRAAPGYRPTPAYRPYGIERREPPSGPGPSATPRQAPERTAVPAYRPYGVMERRGGSSAPAPRTGPSRETSPSPSPAPSGREPGAQSRPAPAQGQADRGTAVRRSGGR